jgi:hypothetical protein
MQSQHLFLLALPVLLKQLDPALERALQGGRLLLVASHRRRVCPQRCGLR